MDDLVTLRILVAANAGPVRAGLIGAAAQATIPLDFAEADDAARASSLIDGKPFDLVMLDCAWDEAERRRVARACRASISKPLIVALAGSGQRAEQSFADASAPKPGNAAEARKLIDGCVRALLPLRVLVVDDSPTTRGIVRKILAASRFGIEVLEADDGAAAFAHVKNSAVDIVFLDYSMPGLDGFATLKALKLENPAVHVIIMTGLQDTVLSERARDAGADGFLSKPFYPDDVDDVLHRLCGLRRLP
jgi:CheY-like chemotaxis protein